MPSLEEAREEFKKGLADQSPADLVVCLAQFAWTRESMEKDNDRTKVLRDVMAKKIAASMDIREVEALSAKLDQIRPAYDDAAFEHIDISLKLAGDELNRRFAALEKR